MDAPNVKLTELAILDQQAKMALREGNDQALARARGGQVDWLLREILKELTLIRTSRAR